MQMTPGSHLQMTSCWGPCLTSSQRPPPASPHFRGSSPGDKPHLQRASGDEGLGRRPESLGRAVAGTARSLTPLVKSYLAAEGNQANGTLKPES